MFKTKEKTKEKTKPRRVLKARGWFVTVEKRNNTLPCDVFEGLMNDKQMNKLKKDFKTLTEEDVIEFEMIMGCFDPILLRKSDIISITIRPRTVNINKDEVEDYGGFEIIQGKGGD